MSPSDAQVRLGVLVEGTRLPAWLYAALSDACAVDGVSLSHLFVAPVAPGRDLLRLPFALYERLDRRLFSDGPDPFVPRDAGPLFSRAEVVPLRHAGRAPDASELSEALAAAHLDVLLHLGSRALAGPVLLQPALGIWTWSQLEQERWGGAAFLTAVERAEPTCESQLLVLRPDGQPHRVLERSWSASDPNAREACEPVSLHRARAAAYWKSAAFPARALRRIVARRGKAVADLPAMEPAPAERRPSPLRSARLAARVVGRLSRRRWRLKRVDAPWHVAVRPRRVEPPGGSMDGFRLLPTPADRFFADPFLVRDGDRHLLFYEDADRRSELGRIACVELDTEGRPGRAATVLEEPHHLSYPCVFAWEDQWWMIPESRAARTVDLYRADAFPWSWKRESTLFRDVRAVDATVLVRAGQLWMFVAMAADGASTQDELFLFHARDPRGPWTPHPENPVVSDVRCARPAGRLFEQDGVLYRPGQDCSQGYGGAIALRRVEVLNEREYRESPAGRIERGWLPGSIGTHTLGRTAALEVVDVRILEPRR